MANTASSNTEDTQHLHPEKGWPALQQRVSQDKIRTAQWAIRLITMLFTFAYLFPIFGNPYDAYYKVLLSCSATNVLRLHQRIPRISFTKEFLQRLFLEDSFHYLFYTAIFQYTSPSTFVIVPVFLFALLHSASYSLVLLDCLGHNNWWGARLLISLVEFQSLTILRICAFFEILILPITIMLMFSGGQARLFPPILTPILYYHFLQRRFASRRNPSTRNVFIEIANFFNSLAMKPNVPQIVQRIIHHVVVGMHTMVRIYQ